MRPLTSLLPALLACAVLVAACGGDDDASGATLSDDAEAGRQLFASKGCASCHGTDIGPSLEGVYGADVELEDGSTVVADDAYIERSIREPGAQKVAGFDVTMPTADVTDEEVRQLVAYVRQLGSDSEGTTR